MLTIAQLRQAAAQSGARDISFVDIDVMLTHLLQLFHERKMVFGPRGAYQPISTSPAAPTSRATTLLWR